MIVLRAHRLFTPRKEIADPLLFIEDGRISAVTSQAEREIPKNAEVIDFTREFPDAILAPGFVDIHMHGGAGVDLMTASPADLTRLNKFLPWHGVTGYFPTTVAAALDETCAAVERLADSIEAARVPGGDGTKALPLGIHLEGPFLSHKRRGVHPPEHLAEPTLPIFERLWQAARGHVRMMTIAPELPGALEVIAEAARRDVCVSIGHSDALMTEAQAGVRAGARHATHTFNAMRPLDHREPGILGVVLGSEELSADMIVDGIHVAPEIVKLFLRTKGVERSVLITDATAAAGMPDGNYKLGPIEVEVKAGRCTLAGDPEGKLAGSVLTMDRAVRNAAEFGDWSLQDAVRAATLNAASAVRLGNHGELGAGAEANVVLLSATGEVRKTIVRGSVS
jgi:N-acetylglucosamine-6-phosphate deacetylase